MNSNRYHERGATAIVIVIFSVLLLLTVTVGFMRLVVQDQNRSTDSELSRGAYDSALAGVEDGKRVLQACLEAGPGSAACNAMNSGKCTTVSDAGIVASTPAGSPYEVKLKQTSGGAGGGFDQAYTCVTVNQKSPDYLGKVQVDKSEVIPLKSDAVFSEITVSWYQKSDILGAVNLRSNKLLPPLSGNGGWNDPAKQTPPLLRVQLIQRDIHNFKVDDFDADTSSRTLFLIPSTTGSNSLSFSLDARESSSTAELQQVKCDPAALYVGSTRISLLNQIEPNGVTTGKTAYLRISPMYGDTDYKVQLTNANFDGVQPIIDSTGRASNVFRRVKVRTEFMSTADIYPRATVDITKNLCKNFSVTTSVADYRSGCNHDQP